LARALLASGVDISRFSVNSAGAAYATALMAAMPEGLVERAYLKSRPNISNHELSILWGLGVLIYDILDDRKYDRYSQDPWKMTPEMIEEAENRLPNIYSDAAQNRHKSMLQKARSSHTIGKLLTDLRALSPGGFSQGHPAAADTIRAIQQQPEALWTFHFPIHDRLYNSMTDISVFLGMVHSMGHLSLTDRLRDSQVEALKMPGRHRDHTKYPRLRWAVETYAFHR
jgi:hypothetical protein